MKFDEFIETEMLSFLNEKIKQVKEAEPVREEESPLLYTGKDFRKDIDVAIAANDLNKAKSIFEACKAEYAKSSGEQKQELFKTLNELYAKIKDCLKIRKRQSLEGEISTFEEEGGGVIQEKTESKEENAFDGLFTAKPAQAALKEAIKQEIRSESIVSTSTAPSISVSTSSNANTNNDTMKELASSIQQKVDSLRVEPSSLKIIQPIYNLLPNASKWTQETEGESQKTARDVYPYKAASAERMMEDKIKEKINESCGVIRLAVEKKDLSRAIVEYNKLKEVYSLIPSILSTEKASIYNKILTMYKQIKSLEQEKLMKRISGPVEHRLTEEELVDKIALRIDRSQAFILNKDLQKALGEYQEANDLFELVPDTLPEIKKKFLVDLARVYQGLQNLNHYLQQNQSKSLFENNPDHVLKKYTPENPVEKIKRSMSKIERYLQAKALKSAMLEFNKIKSMCEHLSSIEEVQKKALFEEIKNIYSKIAVLKEEVKDESKVEIIAFKEPEEKHLEEVKAIHEEIRQLYANLQNKKEASAKENLLEIQHKIAGLTDRKEQEKLIKLVDQLCHKAHFTHQEKRLAEKDDG